MPQGVGVFVSWGVWVDGRLMVLGGQCQRERRRIREACETSELETRITDPGRILLAIRVADEMESRGFMCGSGVSKAWDETRDLQVTT